jgi:nucleoside-diphosphate-sugar epimerase
MRIVITGVAGFIGHSLVRKLLDEGYTVVGIDNFLCGYIENILGLDSNVKFTFINKSILDKEIEFILKKDDILIHLAAISSLAKNQSEPSFSYNNNVCGTVSLLEMSRRVGIKHFIFASTSAIYENSNNFPLVESDNTPPDLVYSLGKKHCEDLIESYYKIYGLQYTILRFFNVFGKNQDANRENPALIPYIISMISKNESPVLHSDGNQKRDYVYVDDVNELILKVINKAPSNDKINVCSGNIITVKDIVETIQCEMQNATQPIYRDPCLLWENNAKLWEGEMPFKKDRMREEVEKYTIGDGSNAYRLYGWKSKTDMVTGIKEIINNK